MIPIALALLSLTPASHLQDAVLLRRTFSAGEEQKFALASDTAMTMEMSTSSTPMDISVKQNGKMSFRVLSVNPTGESAQLRVRAYDMKAEASAPTGLPNIPDYSMTATQTNRGQLRDVKVDEFSGMDEKVAQMVKLASQNAESMGVVFPEKAIKIGETWDVPLPKFSGFALGNQPVHYTLKGIESVGGVECYRIQVKLSVDLKGDAAKLIPAAPMPAGAEVKIDGHMEAAGSTFVSKSTGAMQKMETTVTYKGDTSVNMNGQDFMIHQSQKTTMTLKPI